MTDQERVTELLEGIESFTTTRLERRLYPHPLDPDIEQLIETWTQLPDDERQHVTANLTEKQRIRLFQFTHRIPLRAKGMRRRADKLALIRMAILANTMEGFGEYSDNEVYSNFLSISAAWEIARPWPAYTLLPPLEEAIKLAGPVARRWLQTRYADPLLKDKAKRESRQKSGEEQGQKDGA